MCIYIYICAHNCQLYGYAYLQSHTYFHRCTIIYIKFSPPPGDLWPRPQRRAAAAGTGGLRTERRGRGGLARDPATSSKCRKGRWVNGGLMWVSSFSFMIHRVHMWSFIECLSFIGFRMKFEKSDDSDHRR